MEEKASQRLVTTNHVCGETWTFLRHKAGYRAAVDFVTAVDSSRVLEVQHVTAESERLAWAWLRLHDEREYSFVDATSFTSMQRLRIHEALAFDGDYSAAGFQELRAG